MSTTARSLPLSLIALVFAGAVACGGSGSAPVSAAPTGSACPASSRAVAVPRATFLVQDGHAQPVNVLALSGDGRVLASASLDGTLRIWDTRSGLLLRRLRAPGAAYTVSLDHEGRIAAFADGPANRPTSILVQRLAADEQRTVAPFGEIAVSPDGATLAVARAASLELQDGASGAKRWSVPLAPAPEGELPFVAFARDGRRLAVVDAGAVRVVEAQTGATVRSFPRAPKGKFPFHDMVAEVGLGARAAFRKLGSADVDVLPLEGDATPKRVGERLAHVAWAGDQLWGLSAEKHDVVAVDPATGAVVRRLPLEREPFRMAASADGSTMVLAYLDPIEGDSMEVLDLSTLHVVSTIEGRPTGVHALALSPSGDELAVGSQASLVQWTLPAGVLRLSTPDRRLIGATGLTYDKGGKLIVSIEGRGLRARDVATGRVVDEWELAVGARVAFSKFLPGGELLTVGNVPGAGGEVAAWRVGGAPEGEAAKGRRRRSPPSRAIGRVDWEVHDAALSPDGALLVLGSDDGKLAALDVQTGAARWQTRSPTSGFRWMTFTADGAGVLLSAYEPMDDLPVGVMPATTLRRIDPQTGKVVAQTRPGTAGAMAALPGVVAVGGEHPSLVDPSTLAVTRKLELRDLRIDAAVVAPKGAGFFLGGDGGAVTLVTPQGEVRATLVSTSRGDYVATTPSGAFRSSLDGARSVVWSFGDPLEAFSFEQFASRFERPQVVERALAGQPPPPAEAVHRPPSIRVASGGAVRTDGRTAKLAAHVRSPGQVERVRAFVDGRPAVDRLVCSADADVALDVPVPAGESRVALVAYDSEGLSSNPVLVDVESKRAGARPALWVVAVGVSRYPGLGPEQQLEVADDDARALAEAFGAQAGQGKRFERAHVETILDSDVTPERVLGALAGVAKAAPDDLVVVFLAGHGVTLPEGGMVFLTSRATPKADVARREGIGWTELQGALDKVPARVVVLLDACHSGHVSTERVAPNELLARDLAARGKSGVLVFAAARGAQLSYEVSGPSAAPGASSSRGLELAWDGAPRLAKPLGPAGHGLFTSALLEALAGEAPDRDKSGAVEIGELVAYVTERVRAASNGLQTPWVARREMFGDFALAPARR